MRTAARTRALTGTVELRVAAATDLRRREREQQDYLAWLEEQQDSNLAALSSTPRLPVAEGAASSAGSTWTPVEVPPEDLPDATQQNMWVQVERRRGYRDARMADVLQLEHGDQLLDSEVQPVALNDTDDCATTLRLQRRALDVDAGPHRIEDFLFDRSVMSPRPGPCLPADCFAA